MKNSRPSDGAAYAGYVICGAPRSGSTLLCDLLAESGVAGHPASYFRPADIGYWTEEWRIPGGTDRGDRDFNRDYIAAMALAATGATGRFGLRMMWDSVVSAQDRLDVAFGDRMAFVPRIAATFGPTLFIHLVRDDKTAQAISLVRARQSGLWHVSRDGVERERTAPRRPVRFDARRIAAVRDALVRADASWRTLFERHGVVPLVVRYEELAAQPLATLGAVLRALGADPAAARRARVKTARMADATSRRWTARMRGG